MVMLDQLLLNRMIAEWQRNGSDYYYVVGRAAVGIECGGGRIPLDLDE